MFYTGLFVGKHLSDLTMYNFNRACMKQISAFRDVDSFT